MGYEYAFWFDDVLDVAYPPECRSEECLSVSGSVSKAFVCKDSFCNEQWDTSDNFSFLVEEKVAFKHLITDKLKNLDKSLDVVSAVLKKEDADAEDIVISNVSIVK